MWKAAINDEFKSLENKKTWLLDEHPESQPLLTHLVLKVKRISDRSVERFKARVVAGENHLVYGENYVEVHTPVVSITIVLVFSTLQCPQIRT